MERAFFTIYHWYGKLLLAFAIVAGLATFAIMWIIDINAFSRRLFNAPLPAGVELTQSLLPAVILLPFGYALLTRQHVNTVVLTSRLSPTFRRVLHVFWMLVGFVLFAAVTYGSFQYAMRSYNMNEQVWGATIRFPLWPSKFAVSLGAVLICIQFLLEAIRSLATNDSVDLGETSPDESMGAGAEGGRDV